MMPHQKYRTDGEGSLLLLVSKGPNLPSPECFVRAAQVGEIKARRAEQTKAEKVGSSKEISEASFSLRARPQR